MLSIVVVPLALALTPAPLQRQQQQQPTTPSGNAPPSPHLSRRAAILTTLASPLLPSLLLPMQAAHAISATTMAGKTKAELGIILVDEVKQSGASVSADLVLNGGLIATIGFTSPTWPLAEGSYNDVEVKSRDGDAAFMQVVKDSKGAGVGNLKPKFFTDAILGIDGRYGAYGQPSDVKVSSDTVSANGRDRTLEVSFVALGPSMADVPRKAVVKATQASGSSDVLMLVASTSSTRWKKSGGDVEARKIADSFSVVSTRPTSLKAEPASDYRFGKASGPSNIKSRNDGF